MKRTIKNIITIITIASLAAVMLPACAQNSTEATTAKAEETTTDKVEESASSAEKSAETGDRLSEIKKRGYLLVGTEGTWSPYTYHDENDQLVGFEVDVAKLIADHIGVDVKYSETVWSSIFASLDAGQIDVIVNGVSKTQEREEKYDFSEPYNYSQYAMFARADDDSIQSLDDVNGKIASNDPTSTIGAFAEEHGVKFDEVSEMAQSISEVLNGRSDVTFNTQVALFDYLKQHPENKDKLKIIVVTDPMPNAYVPVVKGNDDLVQEINAAIDEAKQNGTLSDLAVKYFDVDTTKG